MYAAHLFVCKPSKAASSRFLAAEESGEGWVVGVGRFFDVLVHSRNSCKRKFFLRPSVCTICGLEFLVCRVRYVQFVETVLNESYEIVESVRFPGIWANSGFILSLLRSRGTDYTSCFSPV